jgi:hypothetical protein
MGVMEICVIILTGIVVLIGVLAVVATIFLIKFMGSMQTTLQRVEDVLEGTEKTLDILNSDLPAITSDTSRIVSNIGGLTGKIDNGLGFGINLLNKTPLSAVYTAIGVGRTAVRFVGEQREKGKIKKARQVHEIEKSTDTNKLNAKKPDKVRKLNPGKRLADVVKPADVINIEDMKTEDIKASDKKSKRK